MQSGKPWRKGDGWRVSVSGTAALALPDAGTLARTRPSSPPQRQRLLVWTFYRIHGDYTANPYVAKLLEARQQLLEGRREGTRLFLATPVMATPLDAGLAAAEDAARARLQAFPE